MSHDLKDQLIRLGSTNPELREDIRPILAELDKVAQVPRELHDLADALGMDAGNSTLVFSHADPQGWTYAAWKDSGGRYHGGASYNGRADEVFGPVAKSQALRWLQSELPGQNIRLSKTAASVPRPLKKIHDAISRRLDEAISALDRYESQSRQETGVGGIKYDDGRAQEIDRRNDVIDRLDRALHELQTQDRSFSNIKW